MELWQQAHEKGNLDSTFNLANHYERGDGVARDTAKSIELYHQAHMAGMFEASYNLAVRYKRGDFVEKDEAMAFDLFQQAHSAGCNRSPLELGTIPRGVGGCSRMSDFPTRATRGCSRIFGLSNACSSGLV